MLASEFNKLEVYAGGITLIGKVKDQSIDPATYALTDLIVQLRKDAARKIFGKRFTLRGTTVRVPVSEIDRGRSDLEVESGSIARAHSESIVVSSRSTERIGHTNAGYFQDKITVGALAMFRPTCGCEMKQKSVLDTLFECDNGHRESPIRIEYMPLTPEERAVCLGVQDATVSSCQPMLTVAQADTRS